MGYEMKPNTGSYFRNDKKATDKHPDVKGSIKIECPVCRANFEMWQSGWNKQSQNGTQYVSQSFQPKEQKLVENAMKDDYTSDSGQTQTVNPFNQQSASEVPKNANTGMNPQPPFPQQQADDDIPF